MDVFVEFKSRFGQWWTSIYYVLTVLVVIAYTKPLNFEICDIMELRPYIDKVDVQACALF